MENGIFLLSLAAAKEMGLEFTPKELKEAGEKYEFPFVF